MHYIDEGDGEPFLFVHGNPTWSFYWRELIREFASQHRCVALDHIGMGLSDKPPRYNYCLTQHIDNLVTFVEQLDLRNITLVAHDWGGAIGCGAAIRIPDRFKRFVLLNTAIFPPPFIPKRIQLTRIPVLGSIALRGFNLFSRAANSMATNRKGGLPKIIRQGLVAPYDHWRNRIGVYRFVMDIPTRSNQETWRRLEQIEQDMSQFVDQPTLLIWGMRDWCFQPLCMERIKIILPHAKCVPIEDAGHYVVEDATATVIRAIHDDLDDLK